jgi:hypothetical protein
LPSTFFEPSFSLRRLRTTPARKPRTECDCQPVAFIIASIVAPVGDCSIATTRDCFEFASALFGAASRAVCRDGFAVGTAAGADALGPFFEDLDIESLVRFRGGAPHHLSPTSAMEPAGQDLGAPLAPEIDQQYRSNGGRTPVLSARFAARSDI